MKFKSGAEWNGNKNGRPNGSKTSDIRHILAKELARDIHEDTKEIVQIVIGEAKLKKEWALKLYINGILPYCLAKPKNEDEKDVDDNLMAQNMVGNLPTDVLGQIRDLILKSQESQVKEAREMLE